MESSTTDEEEEEEGEQLDPRIQVFCYSPYVIIWHLDVVSCIIRFSNFKVELEKLNSSTDVINKLELDLGEARAQFRILLNESTKRLNQMTKELGNGRCVKKNLKVMYEYLRLLHVDYYPQLSRFFPALKRAAVTTTRG